MKTKTLHKKLRELENITEIVVPAPQVSFTVEDEQISTRVDGDTYPMTREAYERAVKLVGMSDPVYLEKCPAELFLPHLEYWFRVKPKMKEVRLLINPEGVVLYFTRSTISLHSTRQVVGIIEEVLGENIEWEAQSLELGDIRFSALLPYEDEPRKGDPWKGGVLYRSSQVTNRPPEIEAFLLRLVCTNGLVASESLQRFSWSVGADQFNDWVAESTLKAYETVNDKMQKVHQLTEITFNGHTSQAIASIFARYSIGKEIQDQVMKVLLDQGGETMYDVLNAITFVASHGEGIADSPVKARKLMAAGGDLVEHAVCPQCRQVLLS